MTEQVDLSPAGLAKAKKIAEEAWDWPPANRDAACDLAHTLLPVLIDHVQSFTWEMYDMTTLACDHYADRGMPQVSEPLRALAYRIGALLPPRG